MRPTDLDPPSRVLFERGFRDLKSRFTPEVNLVRSLFQPDKHQPHPSIWYAHCMLANGEGDAALAEKIILKALDLQERRDGDPHLGNFRWFVEDEAVIDLNACQFVLEALVHLLLRITDRLPASVLEPARAAMRLALAEADNLDVHWTYTNIHLLDVQNSILGGQLLGDQLSRERGERRLTAWARRTKDAGAPHEFNSPTYSAVQINALASITRFAQDEETRRLALEMEQFVWQHIARYWHTPTMQLSGPHSRAYRRDVVGASGFLKVVLYKLLGDPRLLAQTPYYSGPDAEGEVQVALTEYHCPPEAQQMLRAVEIRDVCEEAGSDMRLNARITPEFALGTMSRPYSVGEQPEPWPAHNSCILYFAKPSAAGYGVLYCRYRINAAPVGQPSRESLPAWADMWDDGVFRTAQVGGRAIGAYGLSPRGQRPISSLRLDLRMLGLLDGDVVAYGDDGRVEDSIVVASGDTYIGIVPLRPARLGHGPPVHIWRDGEEVVISIINYEGPAKVFWEYRSLSGPFFKGNVKNGFALWAASMRNFSTTEDFRDALRSLPLTDKMTGSVRQIAWGEGPDRLVLEYDLNALR
jgi:hypothetical protein